MESEHKTPEIHHPLIQTAIRENSLSKKIASVDVTAYIAKTGLGAKSMKSGSSVLHDLDCQN